MTFYKNNIFFLTPLALSLFLTAPYPVQAAERTSKSTAKDRDESRLPDKIEGLTADQVKRIKDCKRILKDVDRDTPRKTSRNLANSEFPEENLQILEAVAQTFTEIVAEQEVVGLKKKEWLYSMIKLNMGYLQMGGLNVKAPDDTPLNKLIRRKLKEHMSTELTENTELFYSVDQMQKEALQ